MPRMIRTHTLPRQLQRLLAVLGAAAMCAVLTGSCSARGATAAPSADTCAHVSTALHTRGSAVLTATGRRYVPYGINVVGLAHPLTVSQAEHRATAMGTVGSDDAVIDAAAGPWCANTVRFQIQQTNYVSPAGTVNKAFLAAVEAEVTHAESLGLVVVLNCQTQLSPLHDTQQFMPTRLTYAFWDSLASHYGHDPHVVFDLFNEPAYVPTWGMWRNGGTLHGVRFFGMQALADRVRHRDHAANLLWVEGAHVGGKLDSAWTHRITGDGPLEYSEHRPAGPHSRHQWDKIFGYLANKHLAPVVEGEWADYARTAANWACWDDAPRSVPRFLRYLAARQIGMIVTKMVPGQLIESANVGDPTRIKPSWRCVTGLNQGAGHQIMSWFRLHNR